MTAAVPEPPGQPELRASHADRDAVVDLLREAAGEGRLELDELEERVERALRARTYGELAPLTADLPGRHAPGPLAASSGEPLVLRGGMHGQERAGDWTVPARIVARGGLGGVRLDFTRTRCTPPEITIEVHGEMAGVVIVVPETWAVDAAGVDPGMGGLKDRTTPGRRPGTPLVRLVGSGGMAGVRVRHPNLVERRRLQKNPPA
ncbi:DUF1707 domain-containing protein [Streptomyces sp. NPDC007088]|uniref:DUF1707 SHOCT-like domain-containing protein n=1 Tax=Streptomyces sp. NPDC007088 TaxID=3364773 RepID=UPI0036C7E4D5